LSVSDAQVRENYDEIGNYKPAFQYSQSSVRENRKYRAIGFISSVFGISNTDNRIGIGL
jgi:hypothetical protein